MTSKILKNFAGFIESGSRDEVLLRELDLEHLPRHIAIIMDGNGRWAKRRNMPRVAGHRAGAESVRASVETCARLEIDCLTLYAFSTENWKRPKLEVQALMSLLKEFLKQELHTLKENNIKFQIIGREDELENSVRREIESAKRETENNTGTILSIALNYSGRTEIVDAIKRIARETAALNKNPEAITETDIARQLYTNNLPDPALLIRTSGELRISNFLLWQIAESEIYVTETLWPDFRRPDLFAAIIEYQKRLREKLECQEAESDLLVTTSGK